MKNLVAGFLFPFWLVFIQYTYIMTSLLELFYLLFYLLARSKIKRGSKLTSPKSAESNMPN